MDTKYCSGCDCHHPLNDFSSKGNGKIQTRCKVWSRKYAKLHYDANKETYILRKKISCLERQEILTNIVHQAKNSKCVDCKKKYQFSVMEFDHVRGEKIGNISDLVGQAVSKETLLEEIRKCEIVCANCHRLREWNRWMGKACLRKPKILQLKEELRKLLSGK